MVNGVESGGNDSPLVLLVEDYEDTREVFAEYLELSGFRVIQAVDGHEALAKALEHRPDVVIMDLSIPGIDGREATRRLKGDSRTRNIPVLGLSGLPSDMIRDVAWDGFLMKPCLPDQLLVEVKRLVARPRGG